MMATLLNDLRFAARMLAKSPGFALMAVVTLALGIGANTAIFSVVNGVLLRPLPYPEPDRIVRLFETVSRSAMPSDRMEVAPANYLDWQSQARSFSGIAAYGFGETPLSNDGEAKVVPSAYVSHNLFSVLGVSPALGRTFTVEEDNPANEYVAVLSHGLWVRGFGADRNVLGRTVSLDGHAYTIIGVMPAGFRFPKEAEIWTPLALNANQVKMREARFLKVVARVQPGVSIEQARSEMDMIANRLSQQFPQTNQSWGVNVVSMLDEEVGKIRPALLTLFGVVALVLLIACANVANLLLARATARQSEITIRLALGATRWRVVRQLGVESLILALLGGGAGLMIALWGVDALLALAPQNLPRVSEVQVDGRTLAFTVLVSIATGAIFGLVPALQASRIDLSSSMKEEANRASGASRRNRALNTLVVSEVALALVVLASAGLLINSFLRLRRVDSGVDIANTLTVSFSPPSARYNDRNAWRENRMNFFNQLLPRVQSLPGVETVGAIESLPLSGNGRVYRFRKDGEPANTNSGPAATFQVAMTGYFRAAGVHLRRGRLFDDADRDGSPPVAVINETMARRFWPDDDALGKRIVIRNETFAREIIGVVNDVKHFGLDRETQPEMYVPFNQLAIDLIPLVIRTKTDPAPIANAVREHVRAVDPAVAIANIRTMSQIASASLAERRFTVLLLSAFAATALILAAVGVYGVMAYSVTQREREIGIRLALGATARDIIRLIVGRGMGLTLIGLAAGLLASLALTRLAKGALSSLLFDVSATDPLTFVAVSLALAGVAMVACYAPALRATKVDPLIALRR
jgi:putative ABC transport system permease protein